MTREESLDLIRRVADLARLEPTSKGVQTSKGLLRAKFTKGGSLQWTLGGRLIARGDISNRLRA